MKNPFISMFLSGTNKVAGLARAQATAAVKRESIKSTKQMTKIRTDALLPSVAAKPEEKYVRRQRFQ